MPFTGLNPDTREDDRSLQGSTDCEYYWHWDLKGTGLNVWEYRKIMEKMMGAGGLIWYATDDPEISSHPANCLMVRIGARVNQDSIQKFDQIRFMNRFMY